MRFCLPVLVCIALFISSPLCGAKIYRPSATGVGEDESLPIRIQSVQDRGLMVERPGFRSIIRESGRVSNDSANVRMFSNDVLGYITPWCDFWV